MSWRPIWYLASASTGFAQIKIIGSDSAVCALFIVLPDGVNEMYLPCSASDCLQSLVCVEGETLRS
jgi:hypothetical protein